MLAVALPVLLTTAIVSAATGTLGPSITGVGTAFGGAFEAVAGTAPSSSPPIRPALRAPRLVAPRISISKRETWDVRGQLPDGVAGKRRYRLRIYVNGDLAREVPMPRRKAFFVKGVPIRRGSNAISASVFGPEGEGPTSPPIHIAFDDLPPRLTINGLRNGDVVNADEVVVRGVTQAGSAITIRNARTGASAEGRAKKGRFAVRIHLGDGRNRLTVIAIDPSGNRREAVLQVTKGTGELRADLSLSRIIIDHASLPEPITMHVQVRDADGRPVKRARVTFSISPPGLPTQTRETPAKDGEARWSDVVIPREGATTGGGFVTVRVVLEDGDTVQDTQVFSIR